MVNGLQDIRKGIITREKKTVTGVKKSVIDFVIVSNDLVKHIEHIHIDDERLHVLTTRLKTKNGIHHSESDYNLITTKFKLTWTPFKSKVVEVFKYNSKESKKNSKGLQQRQSSFLK